MPSAKKPKPSQHPDEVDLITPSAIFVGKRILGDNFVFLKKIDVDTKTFAPNPNPLRPQHGAVLVKYKAAMDYNLSGGVDRNGHVKPPSRAYAPPPTTTTAEAEAPGAASDLAKDKRTVHDVETDTVRDLLFIDEDDEAYLFAVAKNVFLFKFVWENTGLVPYICRHSLGLDRRHPSYRVVAFSVGKNRDTWQSRTLSNGHGKGVWFLFSTSTGKKVIEDRKGKHWFVCEKNNRRDRRLWIIDPELLKAEGLGTLDVAKFIFKEFLGSIDESKLEENGEPSKFGEVLIAKSLSIIQLEVSYILASWTDFTNATYTKGDDDTHCRDRGLMLPYLSTIDSSTMYTKVIKRRLRKPIAGGGTELYYVKEKLGVLFPMEVGKVYTSTHNTGKARKVNAATPTSTIRVECGDETEDEFAAEETGVAPAPGPGSG